jgi:hypothetical protein
MITHIAVALGNGQARVNARFPCGYGHIGGVGDEYRPRHQGFTRARVDDLRKFLQYLRHFVAALAATYVHD